MNIKIIVFLLATLAVPRAFSMAIPGSGCGLIQSKLNFSVLSHNSKTGIAFKKKLRLAVSAFEVVQGTSQELFYKKVERHIAKASADGAEMLLLPELITLSLMPKGEPNEAVFLRELAGDFFKDYRLFLIGMAKKYDIAILGGSTPQLKSGGVFNTALLVLRDGAVVEQDKLFLTPDEVNWGWSAGTELKIVDSEWGRLVTLICYDCQFPTLSAQLSPYTPDLILVPSMTGEKGYHRVNISAAARSIEQHSYVAITGATGKEYGLEGRSAILSPYDASFDGIVAKTEPGDASVTTADLDLALLRQSKVDSGLYAGKDLIDAPAKNDIVISASDLKQAI